MVTLCSVSLNNLRIKHVPFCFVTAANIKWKILGKEHLTYIRKVDFKTFLAGFKTIFNVVKTNLQVTYSLIHLCKLV